MAFPGKIISNPFNKQRIEFLTTSAESEGKLLEMISIWEPGGAKPVEHYHPQQDEYFNIIEGQLNISLNGRQITLSKGESLQISRNMVHAMWNGSNQRVVARWSVYPALDTEYLLETGAGLAADNEVSPKGTPGILYSALLLTKYKREFRITKPSYLVQRIIFSLLTPFALLKGKNAALIKYIN